MKPDITLELSIDTVLDEEQSEKQGAKVYKPGEYKTLTLRFPTKMEDKDDEEFMENWIAQLCERMRVVKARAE